MNQVLFFTLAFIVSQQSPQLSPTIKIAQKFMLQKGSCQALKLEFFSPPPNTQLTFQVLNKSLLSINPTVFLLDKFSIDHVRICSINKILINQKTFVSYQFTNKNLKYSNERNNTLIVYITEPRDNSQLNDVVWRNQNKKGNYAEFIVETPGDSGTLYYTISCLNQKEANPWEVNSSSQQQSQQQQKVSHVPYILDSCRKYEQECYVGVLFEKYGYYFQLAYFSVLERRHQVEDLMYGKQISNFKTHISLDVDLIEATTYQICSFYRDSQSYKQSNISCFNFSTDSSQSFISVRFKFTSRISFIKLNAFLCFMVNYLGTHMRDIITNEGNSCFINFQNKMNSNSYFYDTNRYIKVIRFTNQTILYIHQHGKNHLLRSNYEQIWNFSQNLSMRFRGLLEQYNITWIKSGKNQGLKPISELLNTSKSIGLIYQATITIEQAGQEQKNVIFNFSIISFQKVGAVSLIIAVFESGIEDQYDYSETEIIECLDYYPIKQFALFYCYKIILTSKPEKPYYYEMNVTMPSKASFKVFYYETNEYPKFPIIVKKVSQVQFKSEQRREQKHEQKQEQKDQQNQQNKTATNEQAKIEQPKVKNKSTAFIMNAFYLSMYLALSHL